VLTGAAEGKLVYTLLVFFGVVSMVMYWALVAGRKLFASASNCFMIVQVLGWIGTVVAVDVRQSTDLQWLGILTAGLVAFTLGAGIANVLRSFRPAPDIQRFVSARVQYDLGSFWLRLLTYGLALICLAVGLLYVFSVGYHVMLQSLVDLAKFGSIDPVQYSLLRTSVSVGQYVGSGYAAQFTAILLPVLISLLYLRARLLDSPWELALVVGLTAADILYMTAAGGRGWAFFAAVGFLILISPVGPIPAIYPRCKRAFWGLLLALVIFYIVSTTVMGRTGGHEAGAGRLAGDVAGEFYNRVLGSQAEGQLELMRTLLSHEPVMGQQWWDDLASIVPWSESKRFLLSGSWFYALLHQGDTLGSMGLTTWGSAAYNWGALSVVPLGLLVGFLLQSFSIAYVRGPKTLSRSVILFAAGYRLGYVRDPYSLLLDGFVTLVLFYGLLQVLERPSTRIVGARQHSRAVSRAATTAT
jgi:hypothetical protein